MDTKKLVILIPSELHKDFKKMCVDLEKTMASIINKKINQEVENYKQSKQEKINE